MGKVLKVIALIFLGMTTAMNLLGGAGTACAAFLTEKYPTMMALYDYRWLYQLLMITTIIIGISGIWTIVKLVKGAKGAYRIALIVLGIGSILGGTQYFASMQLRGAAAPANVKFYLNLLTLVLFLLFGLPGLREKIDFEKSGGKNNILTSGGITSFIAGVIVLSTFVWAAPSHTYMGQNWVEVLDIPLLVSGSILLLGGLLALVWGMLSTGEKKDLVIALSSSGD